MKFTVEKLPAAAAEINALEQSQKELLNKEYETIEKQGLEYVRVRPLQKEIFEIKSNELRSLFKYKAGAIIVIGVVFVKKTQKTCKSPYFLVPLHVCSTMKKFRFGGPCAPRVIVRWRRLAFVIKCVFIPPRGISDGRASSPTTIMMVDVIPIRRWKR